MAEPAVVMAVHFVGSQSYQVSSDVGVLTEKVGNTDNDEPAEASAILVCSNCDPEISPQLALKSFFPTHCRVTSPFFRRSSSNGSTPPKYS